MKRIVATQFKFLTTRKGRGSFEGIELTWSIFSFISPMGSLTEEYGFSFMNSFEFDLIHLVFHSQIVSWARITTISNIPVF